MCTTTDHKLDWEARCWLSLARGVAEIRPGATCDGVDLETLLKSLTMSCSTGSSGGLTRKRPPPLGVVHAK